MRKNFLSYLMLMLVAAFSLSAQAQDYSVKVEWNLDNALEIYTDYNLTQKATPVTQTATSATFDVKQDYYLKAADGYILEAIVNNGTNITSWYNARYNVSQYGATEKNVTVTLGKLETVGYLTFDLVNGADDVRATLQNSTDSKMSSNTAIDCTKTGSQQVALTQYDNSLYITRSNYSQPIYSVKKNGETQTASYNNYTIAVAAGDKIEVAYYDPATYVEPTPAEVSLTLSGDAAAALNNIRNLTTNKSVWAATLEASDYKTTFNVGDKVRLSFVGDYTINSLTANGADLATVESGDYTNSADYVLEGNTVFAVDATKKVYEEASLTVYLNSEMEGVHFWTSYDEEQAVTATLKGQTTADLTINGQTVPAGSYEYQLTGIDGKTKRCFYSLDQGYYLAKSVYNSGDPSDYQLAGSALSAEFSPFYLEVNKINYSAKAAVYYNGEADMARLTSADAAGMPTQYEGQTSTLAEGYSVIGFDPAYNTNFSVRPWGLSSDQQLYVYNNGTAVAADENDMYSTALTDGAVLKVFAAASAPAKTTVTFTVPDGASALVTYDRVAKYTDFSAPLSSFGPTEVTVTPAAGYGLTVNDAAVELTDGSYTFTATGAATVALVAPKAKPLTITSTTPANGETVKNFSMFKASVMPNDWTYEIGANAEDLSGVKLTDPAGNVHNPSTVEIVGADQNGYIYGFSFDSEFTESGEYTMTLAAGTFYEMEWDGDAEVYNKVAGGSESEELTVKFTVDANAKSPLEQYVLTPADGSATRKISAVKVVFPKVGQLSQNYMSEELCTLTNGTVSYEGSAMMDWNSGNMHSVIVNFMDADGNEVTVTEAGTWNFAMPAGLFTADGEGTPAISATFTVDPAAPIQVTADPANGSNVDAPAADDYFMVTFTYEGVNEVTMEPTDALAGCRVLFANNEVAHVEDVTSEPGYMLMQGEMNQVIVAFSANFFTQAGVLKISMDEGLFTMDGGEGTPAVEYELTIGDYKDYNAVFTPANGTEVTDLSEILIEFPGATSATYNEDEAYIILQSSSWIAPTSPEVTVVEGAEHPTFKLTYDLTDMNLKAGTYRLLVGQNTFMLDGAQGCEDLTANWTLVRTGDIDMTWTASPTGSLVNEGWGLYASFVFNENESVSITDRSGIVVKFNDEVLESNYGDGSEEKAWYYMYQESYTPHVIMIMANGGILADPSTVGTLSVTIPAGALSVSGQPTTEAVSYEWNVRQPKVYSAKVTPADGTDAEDLSVITVEFTDATTAELYMNSFISLRSADYTTYQLSQPSEVVAVEGAEHPTFQIKFANAPTALTKYVFNMRAGAFTLDGDAESPEIICNYGKKSGVEGIAADENGLYTVYTISGVLVVKDGSAQQVNALPAGLYIVNGQKKAIK